MINCQSITAKKASFNNFVSEHCPNIIAGCESWLSSSVASAEIFPTGYSIYRRGRSDGYGGVFVACQDTFICERLIVDINVEMVVCGIKQKQLPQPLIICAFYRPPNNDLTYMTDLCNILFQIANSYPDSPIWIAGDINLPNIDWQTSCVSNSTYLICLCNLFLNFLQEYGFTQIVSFPTRGKNILDIFATNRPSLVKSCKPVPGISDHEAVMIYSLLKIDLQPIPKRRIYHWSRGDWTAIYKKAKYFVVFLLQAIL